MTSPSKPSFWQREPALLVGQVQAVIALAATLGFAVNSNLTGSIVSAATLVAALLAALVVRSKVSPVGLLPPVPEFKTPPKKQAP